MAPGQPSAPDAAIIDEALRLAGLDDASRGAVLVLVEQEDDRWRDCCGGGCRPCVVQLAAAVDHVRASLKGS